MSATGNPTTNLGLRIMNGTDPVDVADINANSQTLDAVIGAVPSGKNVKGLIDAGTTATDNLRSSIAIVANGNTHDAISSGQYVYVMNHNTLTDGMYVATANIATNATLSLSNLDALSSGVANGLKSEINTLNGNILKVYYADYTITLTSNSGRTESIVCGITGYTPVSATILQNDDLYYLIATDAIYPNLSLAVSGSYPSIQLLGMNKSFAQVGATRNIKIRVAYTKA